MGGKERVKGNHEGLDSAMHHEGCMAALNLAWFRAHSGTTRPVVPTEFYIPHSCSEVLNGVDRSEIRRDFGRRY